MNKRVDLAYQVEASQVLAALNSVKSGLSTDAARQRMNEFGPNQLKKIRSTPSILKFFRQFKDLMIILLIISSLIAFYLDDSRTAVILLCIVFINALIGFIQEYKAEKIMDSLKKLVVPSANAYRDGELKSIHASELVPGDVIFVSEGDSVPADARIIEESEFATNDFALTGESNPSRKFIHAIKGNVEIGNRRNLIFMGTTVASGNALCVVVATGMHTELGRIASLSQNQKDSPSPLQREMTVLASRITIATLVLASILVLIALGADLSIKDAFLFAIGIASAMIPQGLPAEVNVALSQVAGKLAREKALVKKLSSVESLGATSIICTDKTGTLTKNEMTVEHIIFPGKTLHVSGSGYEPNGQIHDDKSVALSHERLEHLQIFFACGYFASNARVDRPDNEHSYWYCVGDPTEGALVTLARKAGLNTKSLDETNPEIREFPFDSVRKRMSSIRNFHNQPTIFMKGAPESVLDTCQYIWDQKTAKTRKITEADKKLVLGENDVYAHRAMRNLAYAYRILKKDINPNQLTIDSAEQDMVYMGMVSLIDPIRDDVDEAMADARRAHIKVSIITGDYAPTAKAIAVRAKLADHADQIKLIGGNELPALPDSKILELVAAGSVIFARVSPEDKLRIVSLVKNSGQVIAVTGDGINDAPALKMADIGVAMGVTGTDVAKQSAEIVLLDDSFRTLVDAVRQGRTIFQNIKKATLACLSSNFAELVTVLISLAMNSALGIPPAITAIQILAIDLIAELLPIAALGWDKPARSLMDEPPRNPRNHILNWQALGDLLFTGILMGGLAYLNFFLFTKRSGVNLDQLLNHTALYASATAVTYATICIMQYINILIRRTHEATLSSYLFSNRQLWLAFGLSFFCVLNIIYNPLVQAVFGTAGINPIDWLYVLASGIIFFVLRESYKHFVKDSKDRL